VSQDGTDLTIGFSARYVMDVLNAMGSSEQVKLFLNGDLGPGMFQSDKDELYRCIVMPMRFE
jgi:DNA polymerase III sliding clamp (beta) subunit (PCNA family)